MTQEQMEKRIRDAFPDCDVVVTDLTGTQDHWEVRIATQALQGLSRIQKHQKVMGVFDAELKTGEVHALTIKTFDK